MRRIAALVVAGGILLTAAACSSTPTRAGCGPVDSSGNASQLVTATGDFASTAVKVDFPTPLVATKNQVSVLSTGTGPLVEKGDYARFTYSVYDASTGTAAGAPAVAGAQASEVGPIQSALECVTVGSRVALYIPSTSTTAAAVVLLDVQSSFKGKADGTPQLPKAGLPEVVTATDGTPGITVANLPIPTKLTSEVTKAGSGAVVKTGDTVVLNYTVFAWTATTGSDGVVTREASVGKTTWGTSTEGPDIVTAGPWDPTGQTGFFPGTEQALTGQKVGSQVLVVVPPSASFPSGSTVPDSVPDGATRVYVIDILEATAATQ